MLTLINQKILTRLQHFNHTNRIAMIKLILEVTNLLDIIAIFLNYLLSIRICGRENRNILLDFLQRVDNYNTFSTIKTRNNCKYNLNVCKIYVSTVFLLKIVYLKMQINNLSPNNN